jgi:hypothetical protein
MIPSIAATKEGIDRIVGFLGEVAAGLRVGVVTYRNWEEAPAILPLTGDLAGVRRFLWSIAPGGGDREPVTFALERAIGGNRWSEDAIRAVVLVGDEPYQPVMAVRLRSFLERAREEGFVVHAVTPRQDAKPAWDDIARWSGGRSVMLESAPDLIAHVVSLTVGGIWHDQIADFMSAYEECAP